MSFVGHMQMYEFIINGYLYGTSFTVFINCLLVKQNVTGTDHLGYNLLYQEQILFFKKRNGSENTHNTQ